MSQPDSTLPFFAYGLLMPGQPAFFQISQYVSKAAPAAAPGKLCVQDGLPVLEYLPSVLTPGFLVRFEDDASARTAYKGIQAFEPTSIYRWARATVAGERANVLYAVHPGAGNPLEWPDWSGWDDPLLTQGLKVVERTRKAARDASGFDRLFQLQMAYLLLWTALERYVTFRYSGSGQRIEQRIENLAAESGFGGLIQQHVPTTDESKPTVVDCRKPGQPSIELDASKPLQCLNFYRRVRHNATHRGKSGPNRDIKLLDDCLAQLLPIFRGVLANAEVEAGRDRARVLDS